MSINISTDFRPLPTLEFSMKRYSTLVVLCVHIVLYSYAQCPVCPPQFEPVGTVATSSQAASTYRQNTSGSNFYSTSTLILSGSKYASEIDGFAVKETTASGIRRLPNKPSHPQATPVGDVPWLLVTLFVAGYVLRIRRKTHTDNNKRR